MNCRFVRVAREIPVTGSGIRRNLFRESSQVLTADATKTLFDFQETSAIGVMGSYVGYFNHWRPHRSLGQRAPCDSKALRSRGAGGKIIAENVLGGLHHVYRRAVA